MDVQGTADANGLLVAGGAAVVDLGAMTQDGMVNLGTGGADTATLTIAHGGTYDLLGDVSINAFGNAAIGNAGLFDSEDGMKPGITGFPILMSRLYFSHIEPGLSQNVRQALDQANSQMEWNTFLLSSPDFMYY